MDRKGKRNVKVSMNGQNNLANNQHNVIDNNQYYLEQDPDIHNDVEIVLPKDNRQSARSRTTMSAKSRKTVQSKTSETRENIVRSRGRPIKAHETEPFLTIDNLPPEKSFVSEKSAYNTPATTARTTKPIRQASGTSRSLEAQLHRMTAYMSPYNQQTPAPPRSVASRTGRITPANTPFQSLNKQLRQPNHHIKSPFKHAVGKPEPSPDGRQTPSMGMKERTAMAAFHVHKMLAVTGEKDAHKQAGKLKKGKLQPLYPVSVQGPSIEQCRGIISEARSYQPSPSRTLQRRMNLINQIPNVHDYLYERPNTVESVHQTSIASSIDDYDPEAPDTNRSLPDEILYAQEPSNLAPQNTFMPEPTDDDMLEGLQSMAVDNTPRMFATEIGVKDIDDDTTKTDLTVSDHVQHELHVSESTEEIKDSQDSTELTKGNYNNNNIEMEEQTRSYDGRARIGSPSKSVRFAQSNEADNSKEMKQMRNETIIKQQRNTGTSSAGSKGTSDCIDNIDDEDVDKQVIDTVSKKNKENSKGTCKSEDIEVVNKKDNDDSDDDDNNSKTKDGLRGVDHNTGKTTETSGNKTTGETKSGSAEGKDSRNSGSETKDRGNKRTNQAKSLPKLSVRSRSQSRERSSKDSSRKTKTCKSQTSARTSKTKNDSGSNVRCSRFEQSQASKQHINKLEVSSVVHSDGISMSLRPESPKRNRSRSTSPSRQNNQPFQFFAPMSQPCFEAPDDFDCYHDNSQRSKVKFMIEGEDPELETIFMEDTNDVDIKPDKVISYDVLDSEIAMLRAAIQNSLTSTSVQVEEFNENMTDINEQENTESEADSETDTMEEETMDNTDRGDYSNLLEKYRQRCMERSETIGAISSTLVTPRNSKNIQSNKAKVARHHRNSSVVSSENGNEYFGDRSDDHTKFIHPVCFSDSGHGSVDNLSELSRSTSKVSVPKLELGESTSDLGMDSGRSDVTVTNDNADASVTNGDAAEEEDKSGKNLLEIVCDQLSTPVLQEKKPMKRRDVEEDVSNLQVIATTKSISKNSKKESTCSTKAPFPPLCFTINARPPQGYLYYFAYGPDMNPNRFSSYIQRDIKERYWALLFGFNLVFNKRGSSEEAGGFANIEFNPVRSVEGCIYKITQQELHVLDKCIGYPEHYQHLMLPVWLSNSLEADSLGVAQYCVPALTFIAQNKWTETEKPLSCDYALSQCIKSADLVTTEYRDSLKSMATQQPITASG